MKPLINLSGLLPALEKGLAASIVDALKAQELIPESQKVSDAMLKVGFTMIELGQIDNAREHLQALIRQQPDSTVARLADERLKQLGSTTQQAVPEPAN